jgi:hypothetical protein
MEWNNYEGDEVDSSRVGGATEVSQDAHLCLRVGGNDAKAQRLNKLTLMADSTSAKELQAHQDKQRILGLSKPPFNLPEPATRCAFEMFDYVRQSYERRGSFLREPTKTAMMAVCAYYSSHLCGMQRVGRTPEEMQQMLGASSHHFCDAQRAFRQNIEGSPYAERTQHMDVDRTSAVMRRLAALGLDSVQNAQVAKRVNMLDKLLKEQCVGQSAKPGAFLCAIIFVACGMSGVPVDKQQLSSSMRVCGSTLTKHVNSILDALAAVQAQRKPKQ